MKVRRVLELEGPKDWVERTLEKSYVQPDQPREVPIGGVIREISREVVQQ